ncbi:MAG: DUF2202 domain-containing protein [Methanothrix sp.]|nr:MAG: DUF2202 domain-containing protein [Methanothrix sp.]
MRLILILFALAIVAALSGCIQPQNGPEVRQTTATAEWKPDGVVSPNEYARSMTLHGASSNGYSGGILEISWKNDAESLYMALNGSGGGWISIGFEPSEWMKDADIIMGSVQNGRATVLDEYCTGNYGPHENDTNLGGTYDIEQFGGSASGQNTVIEFNRRMNTTDRFDKAFTRGQAVSIIWAIADGTDENVKHNVAKGEGILNLIGQNESAPGKTSVAALTAGDVDGLRLIREEEKVSRDLYQSFYINTSATIFEDTARSEQSHMDAALMLLNEYGLQDPAKAEKGRFANESLQQIYDRLMVQGLRSENDSLSAAAEYEEISIIDLEKQISATDKQDIKTVYEGLLAGSQKHLRAYVKALQKRGIQYSPQHLEVAKYQGLIGSS